MLVVVLQYDEERGAWIVRGAGEDVWGTTDECFFVHSAVDGDVRIVSRVAEFTAEHEYAKAGVMVRAASEAGVPFGYTGVAYRNGTESHPESLWRSRSGELIRDRALTDEITLVPHWFRIDRIGDQVTMYRSDDGREWRPIDQRSISLGAEVSVGLTICSRFSGEYCTAVFDGVRVRKLPQNQ